MTSEDGDESMALLDRHRPIGPPTAAPPLPPKPRGGVRLLSFFLQALVMSVALSVFFLFAGVAALVLLHLCIAGRSLRRRRRHLHLHPLVRCPPSDGPALLSPRDLRALPCFDYPGSGRSATDCAVCLEGFQEGDRCRALPGCNHAFHLICIDRWLVRSPACPICRGEVAADPQLVGWF